MASQTIVLPGDAIDDALIPTHPKKPLRLGPGLRHDASSNEILPTVAGQLVSDPNKNAIRVETSSGRVCQSPQERGQARRRANTKDKTVPPPRGRARHRHRQQVGRRRLLRAPLRLHGARDAAAAVL